MKKVFYIIYRTKNGGYRKGRKPFNTVKQAQAYIAAKGIENWKHIAKYVRMSATDWRKVRAAA